MGYVSAIKPFSTLLAEKKCTTKGSNKEHTSTRMQLHIQSSTDTNFQKMASRVTWGLNPLEYDSNSDQPFDLRWRWCKIADCYKYKFLNYFPPEKIFFRCKNLSLVKKEVVTRGGKVVQDPVIVCGIRFNCRKVTLIRSLMFTNSYLEFPFCLANVLVRWLLTGHWINNVGTVPNIFLRSSFLFSSFSR